MEGGKDFGHTRMHGHCLGHGHIGAKMGFFYVGHGITFP
jgi:hypothetical protein